MKRKFLWFFIISGAIIFLDQITKIIAANTLKGNAPAEIIPGVLELRYIENRGAAWGMMQGAGIFFIILTIAVMVGVIVLVAKMPSVKRFRPLLAFAIQLFAGGIGNLIDRIGLRYVRDFIYFKAIDFPVFNVADVSVTCGVCLLVLLVIFVYREKDYRLFKKNRENGDDQSLDAE